MKKIFSFAVALIACALAFTSCDPKIDSPLVGGWLINGTLTIVDPSTGTSTTYDAEHSINFFDNGQYQYNIYIKNTFDGIYYRGTWSVKENQVTIRTQKYGPIKDNTFYVDSSFQPKEEVATWEIKDHYLYLTYSVGRKVHFYVGSGL